MSYGFQTLSEEPLTQMEKIMSSIEVKKLMLTEAKCSTSLQVLV